MLRLHPSSVGVPVRLDRPRPAAYIRVGLGGDADLSRHREAVAQGARQRGWAPPAVYTEAPQVAEGHGPALGRLEAAIEAGRHDALLITDPGAVTSQAQHLMRLLLRCTRRGVVVGFLIPPALDGCDVMARPPAGAADRGPAAQGAVRFPVAREAWGALARARVEALSQLFPGWRVWLDQAGWHACRRDVRYLQTRDAGAPAFSVHAGSSTALAAQLCWQRAADQPALCRAETPS